MLERRETYKRYEICLSNFMKPYIIVGYHLRKDTVPFSITLPISKIQFIQLLKADRKEYINTAMTLILNKAQLFIDNF